MKNFLLFCFLILGLPTFSQVKDSVVTKTVHVKSIAEIEKMKLDYCKPFSLEIIGLYPIMNELPSMADETGAMTKSLLVKSGFKKTPAGSGNWMKGPRASSSTFTKGKCKCEVFKKYYYNEKQADGYYNLRVTERIICNSNIFMDN